MPTGPYVIYARKSSESEDRQVLSIPAQLRELSEVAQRRGISIAEEFTESCSAREPGRPVFGRLMREVEAGRIRGIVCWKLDRLARNPVDGGALIYQLGKGQLKELVTPEGAFEGTGDAKFMLAVHFGAATKMIDDLSAGVKRGNRQLAEKGRISGPAPLGYIKVREGNALRGAGRILPDPERFHLVKRMFREVLDGAPSVAHVWRRAVADGLTARGDRRRPGGPIHLQHVYHLLLNPIFAGLIVRQGETFAGEHERMITPAEFDRLQKLVHRGDAARPSTSSENQFLCRGLLRCGTCSWLLHGERITKKSGRRFTYYRCGRRKVGYPICRARAIRESDLERAIEVSLGAITLPPKMVDWLLHAVRLLADRDLGAVNARKAALDGELRRVDAQLGNIRQLVVQGILNGEEFLEEKERLSRRRLEVLESLRAPEEEIRARLASLEEAIDLAKNLPVAYRAGDQDEKRRILTTVHSNRHVTNGIPAFSLAEPYLVFAECPRGGDAENTRHSNPLPDPELVLNETKNSSSRASENDELIRWCDGWGSNPGPWA